MNKRVYVIVGIIIGIVIVIATLVSFFNFLYPKTNHVLISKYADKYGVEEALVFAVVKEESGFNQNAVSKKGAIGLMQIMPETADFIAYELGFDSFSYEMLKVPSVNIEFGCFYLNYLKNKFKSEVAIIAAYNAGEGNVSSWGGNANEFSLNDIQYPETKTYVKKVLRSKSVYKTKL